MSCKRRVILRRGNIVGYQLTWEFAKMLRRELILTIAEKSGKSRHARLELEMLRKTIEQEMQQVVREQQISQDHGTEKDTRY